MLSNRGKFLIAGGPASAECWRDGSIIHYRPIPSRQTRKEPWQIDLPTERTPAQQVFSR
jgi:hypothetical protein